jgi:hypothetical protein
VRRSTATTVVTRSPGSPGSSGAGRRGRGVRSSPSGRCRHRCDAGRGAAARKHGPPPVPVRPTRQGGPGPRCLRRLPSRLRRPLRPSLRAAAPGRGRRSRSGTAAHVDDREVTGDRRAPAGDPAYGPDEVLLQIRVQFGVDRVGHTDGHHQPRTGPLEPEGQQIGQLGAPLHDQDAHQYGRRSVRQQPHHALGQCPGSPGDDSGGGGPARNGQADHIGRLPQEMSPVRRGHGFEESACRGVQRRGERLQRMYVHGRDDFQHDPRGGVGRDGAQQIVPVPGQRFAPVQEPLPLRPGPAARHVRERLVVPERERRVVVADGLGRGAGGLRLPCELHMALHVEQVELDVVERQNEGVLCGADRVPVFLEPPDQSAQIFARSRGQRAQFGDGHRAAAGQQQPRQHHARLVRHLQHGLAVLGHRRAEHPVAEPLRR